MKDLGFNINMVIDVVFKKILLLFLVCVCTFSVVAVTMSVKTDKDIYIQGDPIQVWVVMEPDNNEDVKFFDVKSRVVAYDVTNKKLATDVYFKDEDVAVKGYLNYALFTESGVKTEGTGVDYNSLLEEGKYARWFGVVDSAQEQLTVAKKTVGNTVLYTIPPVIPVDLQYIITLDGDPLDAVKQAFPIPQTKLVNYVELVEKQIAFNVEGKIISIKAGCLVDNECVAPKKCISVDPAKPKVCSDGGDGAGCGVNADCVAGLICIAGKCGGKIGDACVDATKCASGFCVNGFCATGDADAPCAVDADCKSGVCEGGKCVGGGDSDGDGVDDVDENQKCLKTPLLKKGILVFPKGNEFAGCIRGDMNFDGVVDGKDYTPWLDDYRVQVKDPEVKKSSLGDMNIDGFIDGKDYTPWLDAYRIYLQ